MRLILENFNPWYACAVLLFFFFRTFYARWMRFVHMHRLIVHYFAAAQIYRQLCTHFLYACLNCICVRSTARIDSPNAMSWQLCCFYFCVRWLQRNHLIVYDATNTHTTHIQHIFRTQHTSLKNGFLTQLLSTEISYKFSGERWNWCSEFQSKIQLWVDWMDWV